MGHKRVQAGMLQKARAAQLTRPVTTLWQELGWRQPPLGLRTGLMRLRFLARSRGLHAAPGFSQKCKLGRSGESVPLLQLAVHLTLSALLAAGPALRWR